MIPATPSLRSATWQAARARLAKTGQAPIPVIAASGAPLPTHDENVIVSFQAAEPIHVGSRSRRTTLALAVMFQLAVLPLLWNELHFAPTMLWTGIGALLMLVALVTDDSGVQTDRSIQHLVIAFVVAYPLCCVLSYLVSAQASSARFELLASNTILAAFGLLYFQFGATIARHPLSIGLIGALLIAGVYGLLERSAFTPVAIYERMQLDGVQIDYQYLGDAFVLTALMVLPRLRQSAARLIFAIFAIVVMFSIPSRSAAFFGIVALLLGTMAWSPGVTRAALLAGVLLLMLSFHTLPLLDSWFAGTRFESILTDGSDTSIQLRNEILSQGLRVISENPLIGYWAFQVDVFGTSGLYVHNALDLWAQAGILPFALFATLWIVALWRCLQLWRADPAAGLACAPLLLFAALSWLFSRNGTYVLLFVALGYLAGMIGRRRAIDAIVQAR